MCIDLALWESVFCYKLARAIWPEDLFQRIKIKGFNAFYVMGICNLEQILIAVKFLKAVTSVLTVAK